MRWKLDGSRIGRVIIEAKVTVLVRGRWILLAIAPACADLPAEAIKANHRSERLPGARRIKAGILFPDMDISRNCIEATLVGS